MFVFLNKTQHVAVFPTGPAAVALPPRVHVEGRVVVVVEGAQPLEGGAGRPQRQVAADDVHDVVGLFDLLDPVVRQGPPVGLERESLKLRNQASVSAEGRGRRGRRSGNAWPPTTG